MKPSIFVLCAAVMIAACNNNPKASETTAVETTDTTGMAQLEALKKKMEKDSIELAAHSHSAASSANPIEKKETTTTTKIAQDNSTVSSSETMSSGSENSAKAKKGWSKTAKGAVIGGVVGAGTGAVVNKKNRAAGAIIGGAVGAGAGAVIGHQMDKKDGRH